MVLKAPIKKQRDFQGILRSMAYAAVIFMCVTAGLYFAGGVNINIKPTQTGDNSYQLQVDKL